MSLSKLLERKGFQLIDSQYTSYLYSDAEQQTGVILDSQFYGNDRPQYRYHEYTGWQNMLMHKFTKLYRFIDDQEPDNKWLVDAVLGETNEEYDFQHYGTDRHINEIDPTKPEYNFESLFEQVYGSKYLYALEREYQYIDLLGKSRYVDYMLKTQSGEIAIELNGEAFHHPLVIDRKRYLSQLLKQNSLVKDGIKVYRWSNAGMADEKKFADQIHLYFGAPETFCEKPSASQFRHICFSLFKYQEDALSDIQNNREAGKDTFLLILPTGTGKTEVFIADHQRQRKLGRAKRALVIVPFKDLRDQTKSRFLEFDQNINMYSHKGRIILEIPKPHEKLYKIIRQDIESRTTLSKEENTVYCPMGYEPDDRERLGTVNDILAVGDERSMNVYMTLYDRLFNLLKERYDKKHPRPWHTIGLTKHNLVKNNIQIKRFYLDHIVTRRLHKYKAVNSVVTGEGWNIVVPKTDKIILESKNWI